MKFYRHKKSINSIENLFDLYFDNDGYLSNEVLLFLVDLVNFFRPNDPKAESIVSIESLLQFLQNNPQKNKLLKDHLADLLQQRKFSRMLSDAGILRDSDFIYEVRQRLFAKILPFQPEKDTLEFVLNQVFFKSSDPIWISRIPFEELQNLYDLIEFDDNPRMEDFLLKISGINFSSQNGLIHPHHCRHGEFFGEQVIANRLVAELQPQRMQCLFQNLIVIKQQFGNNFQIPPFAFFCKLIGIGKNRGIIHQSIIPNGNGPFIP